MKKKWWILLGSLALMAVMALAEVSQAGRHFGGPMGMGPMYRFNLLSEELGLTDNQRAELKALVKDHRAEIQPVIKTVMAKKRALQELVLGDNADPAAIRQASADLGNAIAEAAVLGSSLAQQAKTILTPEQLARVREMMQNRQNAFDKSVREWQEKNTAP